MESEHDFLYRKCMEAVQALFSDTSVSQETTYGDLNTLVEEIEVMKEALQL